MKYLIYGAGTIGITYAWLLSQRNEVDLLVKPELSKSQHLATYLVFMQNNWNLKEELSPYLPVDKYIVAFPSSVGGGRDEDGIEVILFDEPTRLGGQCQFGIENLQSELNHAGIKTHYDANIHDWLKVHYLQQSIIAGAVLEAGDFLKFAHDDKAIKKMVKAFREGIEVCRLQGVCTSKTFPANLFKLPVFLVSHIMQKMFLDPNTAEMVNNHMKKGLPKWVAGYKEVLKDGTEAGLSMTVWKSYNAVVDDRTAAGSDYEAVYLNQ